MKGLWITWEHQRRNQGISAALGWPLHEIVYGGPRILRYARSVFRTAEVVIRERPDVLAVQNPSIVLAIFAVFLKRFLGMKVVIDAHNSGIYPAGGRNAFFMHLARFLQKAADLTIVTNPGLQRVVESRHGKAFVLPDRSPDVPDVPAMELKGRSNIAYICTFSPDEPYHEVLEAARALTDEVAFYVTGDYSRKIRPASVPANVRLLGFVPEIAYWSLLSSVDFVMDLTFRENCLLCGAYEGVAVEKPLILSDTEALRAYFSKGCIYVGPTRESIVAGIRRAIEERTALHDGIRELGEELGSLWIQRLEVLRQSIRSLF